MLFSGPAVSPEDPAALVRRAELLWQSLRHEEAEPAFRQALALDPDRHETLHAYGLFRYVVGDFQGALACYDRILASQPGDLLARLKRAIALIAAGDLKQGYREYETRVALAAGAPDLDPRLRKIFSSAIPMWRGEDLTGKTLYVYFEQGLGDTLQYARYIAMLAASGVRVIFECQPELQRLMQQSLSAAAELRLPDAPLPDADFSIPLMSLPSRFGTTLETVPAAVPYLSAPRAGVPVLVRPSGAGLAVGIVWAGNPNRSPAHERSMPLEQLLPLGTSPGASLFSLQKGPHAADVALLGPRSPVQDLSPLIRDFADTAALVDQLDLIITVDTAVAHLAGALGKPTWVMIPNTADCRWLYGRSDSPWYPTVRLFRQTAPGDWGGVVGQVQAALNDLTSRR